ncbi:hypothetical protein LOTGIDRAFT_164893 [Lottia gigantea]|uniref:Focadhesin C-terminal domain-containing protein n=1 Tax=Lottia gigantea TaxID=225164 RepID=V4A8H7_LOTGI|nr:hypothetical protein LOTGIDRAFT_164893 [Lottia gigantea]ESO89596.1 hypothetical protein LOTGIDRAFT_164893 [Lottia gigantea]
MASKVISTSTDIGIQGNAAWMLGHLYLSACAVTETRASVPPNYSYLKETSVLRSLVDFLLEAGKHGPEKVKNGELKVVLNSLQDEVSRLLPPLNWAGVLSPLMRMEYDNEIKCLCIKLAITQCISSPTAASFISSWLQPTLFSSLTDDCRIELFKSLPLMLKPVQFSVLKIFLSKCCMIPFSTTPVQSSHCVAVLEGLNKALLVHDPPKSVTLMLYETTENLYKAVTDCSDVQVLTNLSKCLFSIPDDRFDTMTADDFTDPKTFIKGVFIRCQLVAMGRQPIVILNSCLDATINNKTCDYKKVFSILCHCFYSTVMSSTESTGAMYLVQWLLELVGHVRNISIGVIQLDDNALPLATVLELLIGVVSAAISIWTMPSVACMINIDTKLLISDVDSETKTSQVPTVDILQCLQSLPVSIVNLKVEPWLQILPKIVNWMVSILELSDDLLSPHARKSLKDCLYLLRDSEEFKKAAVWTQVFTLDQ